MDAGAHKSGNNVGILGGKGARGELHTIRVVTGGADEEGAHLGAGLFGEIRFAGDEDLLHVVWIGQKVCYGESGRNLSDAVQVIAARDVLQPRCARLRGNGLTLKVLEAVNGRVLVNHDGLRVVLHGGGHGQHGKAVRIPRKDLVTGAKANVGLAG